MNRIRNKIQKKRLLIVVICMLLVFGIAIPEKVKANTVFTNAYMYYSIAGNFMQFIPGDDLQGEIYYATKAKKAVNSGILYTTLGWQVVVHDSYGYPVEVIYYQLGGSNMVLINAMDVGGYEYCLYKISFANIKARMSASSLATLNRANSFISFNACTTTKINGVVQGGMTDYGPAWGAVYTTYDGIANAQNWSNETKQTLQSYYNKTAVGMFYSVSLNGTEGIASLSGAGTYCYGATATITTSAADGYEFSHWEGSAYSSSQTHSFVVSNSNVIYTAVAKPASLQVNFYKGNEATGKPSAVEKYEYGKVGQTLPNYGWEKAGYHQSGWSNKKNQSNAQYSTDQNVGDEWIKSNYPSIDLYAVWNVNNYKINYDMTGGSGTISEVNSTYFDRITMPKDGVEKERATLIGWSTKKDAVVPEFTCEQEVAVSDLADSLNLQYQNNGVITLYAVWDYAPEIYGSDIYVALEDAKNGVITDVWLSGYMLAEDLEDGKISFGTHEKNSFLIIDYLSTDFTSFKKDGYITQTFCAIDSVGNITTKQIKVHVVDITIYDAKTLVGSCRFISSTYYKDEQGNFVDESQGGLWMDSIWRLDKEYEKTLDDVFLE